MKRVGIVSCRTEGWLTSGYSKSVSAPFSSSKSISFSQERQPLLFQYQTAQYTIEPQNLIQRSRVCLTQEVQESYHRSTYLRSLPSGSPMEKPQSSTLGLTIRGSLSFKGL